MKLKIILVVGFFFSYCFLGCVSAEKTFQSGQKKADEISREFSQVRKLASQKIFNTFAKAKNVGKKNSYEEEMIRVKERLDLLERNKARQFDVDSLSASIEDLRKEIKTLKEKQREKVSSDLNKTSSQKNIQALSLFEQAEEHFKNKKWKKAIFAYEKAREKETDPQKIKKSIFNTGLSFQNLNLSKDAQAFFQEVIQKFPASKEAEEAENFLKK